MASSLPDSAARHVYVFFVIFGCACTLVAQQPLSLADVESALKDGTPKATIADRAKRSGITFPLTLETRGRLVVAGADTALLDVFSRLEPQQPLSPPEVEPKKPTSTVSMSPPQSGAAMVSSDPGGVKGHCEDKYGQALKHANVVYADTTGTRVYDLLTNNKGDYYSLGISQGIYRVVVRFDGIEVAHEDNAVVGPGESVLDFQITTLGTDISSNKGKATAIVEAIAGALSQQQTSAEGQADSSAQTRSGSSGGDASPAGNPASRQGSSDLSPTESQCTRTNYESGKLWVINSCSMVLTVEYTSDSGNMWGQADVGANDRRMVSSMGVGYTPRDGHVYLFACPQGFQPEMPDGSPWLPHNYRGSFRCHK